MLELYGFHTGQGEMDLGAMMRKGLEKKKSKAVGSSSGGALASTLVVGAVPVSFILPADIAEVGSTEVDPVGVKPSRKK